VTAWTVSKTELKQIFIIWCDSILLVAVAACIGQTRVFCVQVVVLSDVFTDKSQFDWMLTTLLDIHKSHPGEDELVIQYLIVGVCKAAAVVGVVRNYLIMCADTRFISVNL
jgi:hypothetical protein